jgi:hypothetical protein
VKSYRRGLPRDTLIALLGASACSTCACEPLRSAAAAPRAPRLALAAAAHPPRWCAVLHTAACEPLCARLTHATVATRRTAARAARLRRCLLVGRACLCWRAPPPAARRRCRWRWRTRWTARSSPPTQCRRAPPEVEHAAAPKQRYPIDMRCFPAPQVYRGLDVGSAKLPEAQRQGVAHHLLDVVPPAAEYSVGDWADAATQALEDIAARGKTPIVVGGAGLHLRWRARARATRRRALQRT